MNKWRILLILSATATVLLLIYAHGFGTHVENTLDVSIGESGDAYKAQAKQPVQLTTIAGLKMYETGDIVNKVEPIVRLELAGHSIIFPKARMATLNEDARFKYGISSIELDFKKPMPPAGNASLAEIRAYNLAIYDIWKDIVTKFNQANWLRFIDPFQPRLAGRDSYLFRDTLLKNPSRPTKFETRHPDPTYPLSADDWLKLSKGEYCWAWHVPGANAELFWERGERTSGINVLTEDRLEVVIESDTSYLQTFDPKHDGNLEAGRVQYKLQLEQSLPERIAAEAKARQVGLSIDETYQNPAIGGISAPTVPKFEK